MEPRTAAAASPTIQHTFANQGRFFVTVTVRDDLGQTATSSSTIVVASGLTASFTASQIPPPGNHQESFDASNSVSNTGTKITDYTWDFGDGGGATSTGSTATTTHTYAVPGTYSVKLTITDDKGRTATTTVSVTVA